MTDTNDTPLKKFRGWFFAAIGTIIVGLSSLWVQEYWGPSPPEFCAEYKVPDHVKEMISEATSGKPRLVQDLAANGVLRGDFLLWVVECGVAQKIYERDLTLYPITVKPHSKYTTNDGRECRKLWVSDNIKGNWQGSEVVFCKDGGKWAQKNTSASRLDQKQNPQNTKSYTGLKTIAALIKEIKKPTLDPSTPNSDPKILEIVVAEAICRISNNFACEEATKATSVYELEAIAKNYDLLNVEIPSDMQPRYLGAE